MGLKEFKEFKRQKQMNEFVKSFLSSLNLTIDDIKSIKDMKFEIAKLKLQISELSKPINTEISDEEKKEIEKYNDKHISTEEAINMFKGDIEEFYPNGRPKEQN